MARLAIVGAVLLCVGVVFWVAGWGAAKNATPFLVVLGVWVALMFLRPAR